MKWYEVLKKHFEQNFAILGSQCSLSYNGNTFFIRKRSNPNSFKIMLKNPNNPERYINDNISLSELISTIKNYNEDAHSVQGSGDYLYHVPIDIRIENTNMARLRPQSYDVTNADIRRQFNEALSGSLESYRMPTYGHYHPETDQQLSRRITHEQSLNNSEIRFIDAHAPTQGGYYSAIFDPEESEVRAQGQLTTCNCDDCLAEREET